jgi:hypothetical protein
LNDRVLKFQTVKVDERTASGAAKTSKEATPPEKIVKISEPPGAPEGPRTQEREKAKTEGGE